MSYALVVHKEANGVDGGKLNVAGTENVFSAIKLTHMLVNENDNTVLAFRPYSNSINPNQIDLSPGVYRMNTSVTVCNYNNSSTTSMGARAGLYNVSLGDFQKYFGSASEKILSNSVRVTSTTGGGFPETNAIITFDCLFSVSSSINSFEIRVAIKNDSAFPTNADDTMGDKSSITTGALPEYYAFIKILRLA